MTDTSSEQARTVLMWLRFFAAFVFLGFLVAVIYHHIQGSVLHRDFPWNTYLFDPVHRFTDWTDSVSAATDRDPYYKAMSAYFPFAYVMFWLSSDLSVQANVLIFLTISLTLMALGIGISWRMLIAPTFQERRMQIAVVLPLAVTIAFCYPLHIALDRGNIDAWIGALCLLYVVLLRSRYAWIGSIALGIAIALKGYPAAFCLLALSERKYVQMLLPVLLGLVLTLASFNFFKGGFHQNLAGFRAGVELFRDRHVVFIGSIRYSSDPYNGIRIVMFRDALEHAAHLETRQRIIYLHTEGLKLYHNWGRLLKIYNRITLLFAAVCAYFTLFVPGPRWRRVTALCLLAILFPDIANDYKLLALLPGLLLLIAEGDNSRRTWFAAFCFAGLLIPKNYWFDGFGISNSGLISPILLLGLAAAVFVDGKAWMTAFRQTPARIAWYLSFARPTAAAQNLESL